MSLRSRSLRRGLVAAALLLAWAPFVVADPPAPTPAEALGRVSGGAVLGASVPDVWAALTTKKGIEAARGGRAEVDLRFGGSIRWHADPAADPTAPGWRVEEIVAIFPIRTLVTRRVPPRSDEGSSWAITTIESLGANRTSVGVSRAGPHLMSQEDAVRERVYAEEALLLAPLEKRFPARVETEDPVGARFAALRGTWETRAGAPKERPEEVQGRLVVETGASDGSGRRPFALLRRYERVGGELRLRMAHHFSKEHREPWRGTALDSSRLVSWDVDWQEPSKTLSWGNSGPGGHTPTAMVIHADAPDGSVRIAQAAGCIGWDAVWTRVPEPR